MLEEILCVSQQFLVQSFSVYLDEKFNLNESDDKSVELVEGVFEELIKLLKLMRKNLCFVK